LQIDIAIKHPIYIFLIISDNLIKL
jgi:hypothetical protein